MLSPARVTMSKVSLCLLLFQLAGLTQALQLTSAEEEPETEYKNKFLAVSVKKGISAGDLRGKKNLIANFSTRSVEFETGRVTQAIVLADGSKIAVGQVNAKTQ